MKKNKKTIFLLIAAAALGYYFYTKQKVGIGPGLPTQEPRKPMTEAEAAALAAQAAAATRGRGGPAMTAAQVQKMKEGYLILDKQKG